jgi:hypothetical protein
VKCIHRLLPLAGTLSAGALTPPTDLIYGHYEIQVDYTVTPENPDAGWSFAVSYDQDDDFSSAAGVVRLDPESTVIVASPRTRTAVPSPAGVFSRFGPSGTPIWILPQNNILGTCFLGGRRCRRPVCDLEDRGFRQRRVLLRLDQRHHHCG